MRKYRGFELAYLSNFVVFVPVGARVHVSHWYGHYIVNVRVMSREAARREWRELLRDKPKYLGGKYTQERTVEVTEMYLGLDRRAL